VKAAYILCLLETHIAVRYPLRQAVREVLSLSCRVIRPDERVADQPARQLFGFYLIRAVISLILLKTS
jgi:hypothetical protein